MHDEQRKNKNKMTNYILKMERIETHCMMSSNLKQGPLRKNYTLLNNSIYNLNINIKPEIIEDLMDIAQYFKNFMFWGIMDGLKPTVRPILNKKLSSAKPANEKMRKLVIREWWRSVLWFVRVKKLYQDRREQVIPELYSEYETSSWTKMLEFYDP